MRPLTRCVIIESVIQGRYTMTPEQRIWAQARDRLVAAATALGFSGELAELLARELKSPKAIDRMTAYIHQAKPNSEEMLVDEMLAIREEIDTWKRKKESEEAQARYNARLYYGKLPGED